MGVPVVELSGLREGGVAADDVGAAIDNAGRSVGFFSVTAHGVDHEVIEGAHRAALAFFDLPVEARLGAAKPSPNAPYGYVPFSAEALSRSIGGAGPPDLKETYNVGPVGAPPRPLPEMTDPDERDVEAPDGALVINLGDLMQRWTNDRWRSTMHRVVVPEGHHVERRLTMPFFHNANWDARVECIVVDGERARHQPVLAGTHLTEKFRSTVTPPPS